MLSLAVRGEFDDCQRLVKAAFADQIAAGLDIRPTIAITKAHINMPELMAAIASGRLKPDGDILEANGESYRLKDAKARLKRR